MPKMAWVGTNGLNAWVIVLSGELSMMRVPEAEEFEFDDPVELLDEHAPTPAARRAAAVTAASFLWPRNLEFILVFLSVKKVEGPRFLRRRSSSSCPTPLRLREDAGRGDVEPPAGGRAYRGDAPQRGVVRAAAVIGQRAPGAERAADGRRAGARGLAAGCGGARCVAIGRGAALWS
jgi:hypothetical protein